MAEKIDQGFEENQSKETDEPTSIEIDGVLYVEDSENEGQAKNDEEGNPIPFEKKEEEEPEITLADTHRLTLALQKGYTINRQDMAKIRGNLEVITKALSKLGKKEEDDEFDDDEPLTTKKLLEVLDKRESSRTEQKTQSETKLQERITSQLDELKAQGAIPTKKDEDELLEYAVKIKETNLGKAYERLQEVKAAKNEGIKTGVKGKVKKEAGSKVGTSKKAGVKEQGFDYNEIAGKDMEELAED